MPPQSIHDKSKRAPPASVHVLDPVNAKRMNAMMLSIPGPANEARAINTILRGQTRTIVALPPTLASKGDAEVACLST
ncbi:MAG: hypothetical protein ABIQ99_02470 [Thermoflexales bacterium]